jgi:hypothetical protein
MIPEFGEPKIRKLELDWETMKEALAETEK